MAMNQELDASDERVHRLNGTDTSSSQGDVVGKGQSDGAVFKTGSNEVDIDKIEAVERDHLDDSPINLINNGAVTDSAAKHVISPTFKSSLESGRENGLDESLRDNNKLSLSIVAEHDKPIKFKRNHLEVEPQETERLPLKKSKISEELQKIEDDLEGGVIHPYDISSSQDAETSGLPMDKQELLAKPTVDILHSARVIEEGKPDKFYYNDKPFIGLEDAEHEGRKVSILDRRIDVYAKSVKGRERPSQTVTQWALKKRSNKLNDVIDFGADFKVNKTAKPLLEIYDDSLQDIIRSVVEYYPSQALSGTIAVYAPFQVLIHHYRALCNEYNSGTKANGEANYKTFEIPEQHPYSKVQFKSPIKDLCNSSKKQKALKVLLEFLKPTFEKVIFVEEEKYLKSPNSMASWTLLWLLLRPGVDVYSRINGCFEAFVVTSVSQQITKHALSSTQTKQWLISVWNLAHTGRQISRHAHSFTIDEYEGEREITTLDVFPCSFFDVTDNGDHKNKLIRRGEKYYNVVQGLPMHVDYKGFTLERLPREYNGEIMIDPGGYLDFANSSGRDLLSILTRRTTSKWNSLSNKVADEEKDDAPSGFIPPRDSEGGRKWSGYNQLDLKKDAQDDHVYLLFPRPIPGFALKDKTWRIFDIDNVDYIDWPKKPNRDFSHIFLPNGHASILKSLARPKLITKDKGSTDEDSSDGNSREQDDIGHWQADWVPGKGRGQIFLLHGPPGTGKTYSVECVAEFTRRPLLTLTPADTTTHYQHLELELGKWFSLAAKWGAVMLIDEAEVYMEKRSRDHVEQNSLCSVFLRSIEYYTGMLFLTTNRVGHFDEAFLSRIEVALPFPDLTAEGRRRVWESLWQKISDEAPKEYKLTEEAKRAVSEQRIFNGPGWNGREIRNALQTAMKLAKFDAKDQGNKGPALIKDVHFRTVADMRTGFEEYIDLVHNGISKNERAQQENARYNGQQRENF